MQDRPNGVCDGTVAVTERPSPMGDKSARLDPSLIQQEGEAVGAGVRGQGGEVALGGPTTIWCATRAAGAGL